MTKENLMKILGYLDLACAWCYDATTYETIYKAKRELLVRWHHLFNERAA